jgi:mRNA interferase RelE/StbE
LNVAFKASFARDLTKVRDERLRSSVREAIEQVEQANTLQEIVNLKKLKGGAGYYRIRIGDYRLGVSVKDDTVTFVRFLHRKDIYRYFP